MKIAVNIQPLLHKGKSGIGYYQSELLKALLKEKKDEYFLQYFDISGAKKETAEKYERENAKLFSARFNASLYQLIWAFVPFPYSFFFKEKPDVSAFFNYYLPPFARGKKVLAVYDTVIKDMPETVRFKTKTMLTLTLKPSIKRADRIVTISQFSKRQIMKHFNVPEEKISVIPCAADPERFHPIDDEKAIKKAAEKYGINGEYFLYLGNLEPRKNIVRLIGAYDLAAKKKADIPKLVISGGKGWLYEEIFEKVKALGLEKNVIFTGYLDEDDVPLIINGARAFCFPSLYEGFGMPPLEAMSCGVPVMAADCTSLPEVLGGCGIKVDPFSEESMAAALIKFCDKNYTESQKEKCLEQSKAFSWKKSAGKMRALFEELAGEDITDK